MNNYCVYNPETKYILYINTSENCAKYIRKKELEGYVVAHIHDVGYTAIHAYAATVPK